MTAGHIMVRFGDPQHAEGDEVPTETWFRLPAERRQAVLAAAEAEFGALGFSRGSLNAIARAAGVSKGSLFQYFTDKADLCIYVSEVISQRVREALEERIAALPWTVDFFGALRTTCRYWMSYFATHPAERALAAAVHLELDRTTRAPIQAAVDAHYVAVFRPLLDTARDAGQLRPDADLDALLALLMLVLPHLAIADTVLGLDCANPAAAEQIVDRLVAALATGFN